MKKRVQEIHDRLFEVVEASTGLTLEEGAASFVDAMLEMKLASSLVDDTILREVLRRALSAEAFALDAALIDSFAVAIERWRPKLRRDIAPDVAAHVLFHGLRAVMVVGAIGRPELTRDPRLRNELVHLVVSYLAPRSERAGSPRSEAV